MSAAPQFTIVETFEAQHPTVKIKLEYLENRVTTLEDQLQRAIAHAGKKEAYANTLASDLEHIIIQLQRLEVVK